MINRLRNRFIRIATLSVAAVMLLLTAILNVANYAATDADLRSTLQLISDNRGTIPLPEKPGDVPRLDRQPPEQPRADGDTDPADEPRPGRNDPFTAETPYSTRYFVLFYQEDGTLVRDAGSLNGTYVNRELVDEVLLHHGDEVQIGKFRLVFYGSAQD